MAAWKSLVEIAPSKAVINVYFLQDLTLQDDVELICNLRTMKALDKRLLKVHCTLRAQNGIYFNLFTVVCSIHKVSEIILTMSEDKLLLSDTRQCQTVVTYVTSRLQIWMIPAICARPGRSVVGGSRYFVRCLAYRRQFEWPTCKRTLYPIDACYIIILAPKVWNLQK